MSENSSWFKLTEQPNERDHRQYPYGYFVGGTFVLDTARIFLWFKSLEDLLFHLREVEPRVYFNDTSLSDFSKFKNFRGHIA